MEEIMEHEGYCNISYSWRPWNSLNPRIPTPPTAVAIEYTYCTTTER